MNFTSLEKQQDRIWGAIIKDDVKKFAEDKNRLTHDKKQRQVEMAAIWKNQMENKVSDGAHYRDKNLASDHDMLRLRDMAEEQAQKRVDDWKQSVGKVQVNNYHRLNREANAKANAKSPGNKKAHKWQDNITENVLLKEAYLQKANCDKKVKQKLDLDMHLKLRSQRKLIDNYDDVKNPGND